MNIILNRTGNTLFRFGIDQSSRAHLSEAAKWAKFLAIVGFVMCGLIVVIAIFAGSILALMSNSFNDGYSSSTRLSGGMGAFVAIFYIGIAILFFLPYLFLLQIRYPYENCPEHQ
jgi:L-cystine uptake protein TcyP (sodium:dicarboxylate symporter family)